MSNPNVDIMENVTNNSIVNKNDVLNVLVLSGGNALASVVAKILNVFRGGSNILATRPFP
jgi:hypothetical protein